ncbi:MAG: uroporphyrinogen decarboxylase family protein [Armatimonadetes bacterium]|nr:uroporphyrinogen decarboxylase family protein [Armatimonadota bacterium]
MTSRERVKRAIHFLGPDRMPHFLPDGGENDILWLWLPGPPDIQEWESTKDGRKRKTDCWGITWETRSQGSYGEAVDWPIKDITAQADYQLPDLNNPKYFEEARRAIAENNASSNPKYCLGVMPFNSLNEGTHNLIGLQKMFIEYYEHPEDLKALIERLAAAQRESIRMLASCGCDGVMGYDDWGLQDRLMVSLHLIEEFFMPHYRKNWSLAHELGMDVWIHSCGHILDLLPLLIDAGLNVIQMDQQEHIGLEVLNERVGGKVAFWCPVDIQKTMAYGSPEDVRAYVKRMVDTLGSHNGGLISMFYGSPDACGHTRENIEAMCKAFREYG